MASGQIIGSASEVADAISQNPLYTSSLWTRVLHEDCFAWISLNTERVYWLVAEPDSVRLSVSKLAPGAAQGAFVALDGAGTSPGDLTIEDGITWANFYHWDALELFLAQKAIR